MAQDFQARFVQEGLAIDHTPVSAVAAGAVVVQDGLVGIAVTPIEAGRLGALRVDGVFDMVKATGAITAGQALFWDADGDPVGGTAGTGAITTTSTANTFVGHAVEAAAEAAEVVRVLLLRPATYQAGTVARASLVEDGAQPYMIPVEKLRVWDAPQTNLPATPATDDLGLVYNTFLTAPPSVESGDLKAAGATSRKVGFSFEVPPEYVAGQPVTLRINAGMKTTVADTSATIDAQAARRADPTTDVVATAAQSINSLTPANKDFTITPTNVVPGDVLDVVLTMTVTDGATGTAVIGKINSVAMLLDIKG